MEFHEADKIHIDKRNWFKTSIEMPQLLLNQTVIVTVCGVPLPATLVNTWKLLLGSLFNIDKICHFPHKKFLQIFVAFYRGKIIVAFNH